MSQSPFQRKPPGKASAPEGSGQSLGEISHLFLTDLRQRQTAAFPRSPRKPPAPVSVDPTPRQSDDIASLVDEPTNRPTVSLVLAHHLGDSAADYVRKYAGHLTTAGRIGLIEVSDEGLRLSSFETSSLGQSQAEDTQVHPEPVDGKRIGQAIEEMSWDIHRWLVYLPESKSEQARKLMEQISQWTLLIAADDEGLVTGYRAIKGLAGSASRALSLAIIGAEDEAQATIIYRKLSGASTRFLQQSVAYEAAIAAQANAAQHTVLSCRADPGSGIDEHWKQVAKLAAGAGKNSSTSAVEIENQAPAPIPLHPKPMKASPPPPAIPLDRPAGDVSQVLDLPDGSETAEGILGAIAKEQTQWIASPIKPPMSASSTVAVDREGRLALLSVAAAGLSDLRQIGQAYQWLNENRALVRMALPQMNIDAAAMPRLHLFVDQSDVSAQQLAPIFQSNNVTIQTYRRLRWGSKTGLLLEAA